MTRQMNEQVNTGALLASGLYPYELHLHTGEFGWCAHVPAATIVRNYEALGYAGIVVTNHYFEGGFAAMPETSWAEKIENYLRGYEAAVAAVSRDDFDVLLGIELRFTEHFNDYLVYGMTPEQLIQYPKLYEFTPSEFRKLADSLGWAFVQAHPFRRGCEAIPAEYLHGMEVKNMNPRHDSHNDAALAYAVEHGLAQTCGSDYHQLGDEAKAAMCFTERLRTSIDLAKLILADYEDKRKAAPKPQHTILLQTVDR